MRTLPPLMIVSFVACIPTMLGTGSQATADDKAGIAFFEQKIRPALVEHCYACHSASAKKIRGGLLLDSKAGWEKGGDSGQSVIKVGKATESQLIKSIKHEGDYAMPPGKKLPDAVIADFVTWINMGAPDPRVGGKAEARRADSTWWSLQPVKVVPPQSKSSGNPIDAYIEDRLKQKGLTMSPPADARTLIRRMTYDLIGLPPSPSEVAEFTQQYQANADIATAKLVDRLLASPHYGERWGRHWLDVVRFGESNGFERNVIIDNAWYFRDYVIESLNQDKPFNQFIIEHLAGDVVGKNNPKVEIGTTFLVAGPFDDVGNQDVVAQANIRAATLDDMITATSSAFLGLTIHCARCHHHKFDPIPTEDYYRIRAAMEGVRHSSRKLPMVDPKKKDAPPKLVDVWAGHFSQPNQKTFVHKGGDPSKPGEAVLPSSLSVLSQHTKPFALAENAPEGQRRLELAKWITANDNPLTARVLANRVWHYHFGTGIVDTPSDFGFLGSLPTHPELLDWLANQLMTNGWKIKGLHREIMLSKTYRQASLYRDDAAKVDQESRLLWRFPPRRLSGEELRDTMLEVSGQLNKQMGGPGFRLYLFTQNNVCTYIPLEKHGPETYRRAVYHQNVRASVVDLLSDFDLPDNAFSVPKRANTISPMQALTMLNHSFTLDMAKAFANQVSQVVGEKPVEQVQLVYQRLFQRLPTEKERDLAVAYISKHGLSGFCRVAFNLNELIYLD